MFPWASQQLITGGTFNYSTHSHTGLKGGYERLIEAVAPNSLHDSGHVFDPPKCHPGTRIAVIQTIIDWVGGVNNIASDKQIIWVTGAAGAGKSAIGRSVCERCKEQGILLAGFFFGANDATRNHSKSLVATIAYQISLFIPGIRQVISDVIEYDPLIFTRSLRTQFTSLVINPLMSIFSNERGRALKLIVIDGLDECDDLDSQRDILDTLIYASMVSNLPIRFLLCSRPENHILHFFSSPKAQGTLFKIFLGDEYSPNKDIELYLSERFNSIKEGHIFKSSIPKDWPSKEHVHAIVEKSSGQFIYAATIVRYVDSSRHRPNHRLEAVLGLRPSFSDLPFSQLDALYSHILSITNEPALSVNILTFPALYPSPLADTVETILGLEPGDVEVLLSDLGSIIQIDSHRELKLLHRSFTDFLFDRQRSRSFFKDRTEIKAWHTLRLIQFFSERHEYCKTKFYNANTAMLLNYVHVGWDIIPAYREALGAMIRFPMESFCMSIFVHENGCLDAIFLTHFFRLLSEDTTNTTLIEAYHRHVQVFCQCALLELRQKYVEDWEVNYALSISHLKLKDTISHHHFENSLGLTLGIVSSYSLPAIAMEKITSTFQRLLTSEEMSSIISKGAAYCLQVILNRRPETRKKQNVCLQIMKLSGKLRFIYPWRWHRGSSSRLRMHQGMDGLYSRRRYKRFAFRDVINSERHQKKFPVPVFPVAFMHRLAGLKDPCPRWTIIWSHYRYCLKDLIELLPEAGRYPPLIHLCKTGAFSPLSMAFPALSHRARLEIKRYLDRVDFDPTRLEISG